jgi:hypothetical protein
MIRLRCSDQQVDTVANTAKIPALGGHAVPSARGNALQARLLARDETPLVFSDGGDTVPWRLYGHYYIVPRKWGLSQ